MAEESLHRQPSDQWYSGVRLEIWWKLPQWLWSAGKHGCRVGWGWKVAVMQENTRWYSLAVIAHACRLGPRMENSRANHSTENYYSLSIKYFTGKRLLTKRYFFWRVFFFWNQFFFYYFEHFKSVKSRGLVIICRREGRGKRVWRTLAVSR